MNDPTAYLLAEIDRLKSENRLLRARIDWYKKSRNQWRHRAKVEAWGRSHNPQLSSTPSTELRTAP